MLYARGRIGHLLRLCLLAWGLLDGRQRAKHALLCCLPHCLAALPFLYHGERKSGHGAVEFSSYARIPLNEDFFPRLPEKTSKLASSSNFPIFSKFSWITFEKTSESMHDCPFQISKLTVRLLERMVVCERFLRPQLHVQVNKQLTRAITTCLK